MMLGNVAPAPLSFTCAAAGAASVRAARASSLVVFMAIWTSGSVLERELGLKQGLRTRGVVGGVQDVGLIVRVIPVREQAPVGRQLIGYAADEQIGRASCRERV